MRPELIENPVFLRYYEKWQKDPTSVVFAAISEIFRTHGMIDQAIEIALAGLKHHPNLVSGRLALARAYLARGEAETARKEALLVLNDVPDNEDAKAIAQFPDNFILPTTVVEGEEITEETALPPIEDEIDGTPASNNKAWHTITMARIFKSQGYLAKAKEIYEAILKRDPDHEEAKNAVAKL